ncbi:MAG TPA: hypothetical protein DDW27_16810 [Bacteroidales bacterium]|nr:hypothetical protein [Bacteroidales bacterium]
MLFPHFINICNSAKYYYPPGLIQAVKLTKKTEYLLIYDVKVCYFAEKEVIWNYMKVLSHGGVFEGILLKR